MPVIQKLSTLTTGLNNDNVWANSAFEFMRGPGVCTASLIADVIGAFFTIQAGPDVVVEESPCVVLAAGVWPVVPDAFYYTFGAAGGDRLVCRLRNPTGGTINFRSILQITYV